MGAKRRRRELYALVALGMCSGCQRCTPFGSLHFGGPSADSTPMRDDWTLEYRGPFVYLEDDGTPRITSLSVGGTPYASNFANRGDVVVQFADTSDITIEMRRFTMAANDDEAEDDFASLSVLAYAGLDEPRKPAQVPDTDRCIPFDPHGDPTPWPDQCSIRVYYDGLAQLERSGADLRITLPRGYAGALEVVTTDDDVDGDYRDRGDVCIAGLAGSADVSLESGRAFVVLADDVSPDAGGLGIDGDAADITVDVPATLWTTIDVGNANESSDDIDEPCGACETEVSIDGFVPDAAPDGTVRDPWRLRGTVNDPGPATPPGAGYRLDLVARACGGVVFTGEPGGFVGFDAGDAHRERHGDIEVCPGCLRGMTCEALLGVRQAECG